MSLIYSLVIKAPTHTFVEKLQTISTKYRRLDNIKAFPANFLCHYYDVYCLLGLEDVQTFMQESAYEQRKRQRFRTSDEQIIAKNQAFVLSNQKQRVKFSALFMLKVDKRRETIK